MREADVIARLRRIATSPAARGLLDDVALLDGLVLTHDTIAEGVHFLPFDPPSSVGPRIGPTMTPTPHMAMAEPCCSRG